MRIRIEQPLAFSGEVDDGGTIGGGGNAGDNGNPPMDAPGYNSCWSEIWDNNE
ncbi:MAG: hypothetical protein J6Y04_08400 [Bacteroidaceae bacterium]|nr:hypothetical protein [Bacteroidaceae bacterium]